MTTFTLQSLIQIARANGANKWATQKWYVRGIPLEWQLKLIDLTQGAVSRAEMKSMKKPTETRVSGVELPKVSK